MYHLVTGKVNVPNIIRSKVSKQFQHEQNGCEKFCGHFQSQQGKYTKVLEFINKIPSIKNYSCEYNFCLEKVGLFVHHLESLHVAQFGNHCM